MITMPIGFPKSENFITADTVEKNNVIFSKIQTCIQSAVGHLKSGYGGWGSTVSSPSRVLGRALAEIKFDAYWPWNLPAGGNNFNDFAKNQLFKFCAVFFTKFAIVITMPIGYPEWENIITADTMKKHDVIFSKRQACIQSKLLSYFGFGGHVPQCLLWRFTPVIIYDIKPNDCHIFVSLVHCLLALNMILVIFFAKLCIFCLWFWNVQVWSWRHAKTNPVAQRSPGSYCGEQWR